MEEIWKDIKGYEGLYQVSNLGRVISLNYRRTGKNNILTPSKDKDGYSIFHLCNNGKKQTKKLHRLVAEAFIPNPDKLPDVNHISEDKADNSVENLEWCTRRYNCNFGTRNRRMARSKTKGAGPITCPIAS